MPIIREIKANGRLSPVRQFLHRLDRRFGSLDSPDLVIEFPCGD